MLVIYTILRVEWGGTCSHCISYFHFTGQQALTHQAAINLLRRMNQKMICSMGLFKNKISKGLILFSHQVAHKVKKTVIMICL